MEHNLIIRKILRTYLPITMLVSLTSTVATFIKAVLLDTNIYYINLNRLSKAV